MLLLLFYVGDNRYAIDTSQVVEVIPRVELRKVYHAPDFLSGIFNYRGAIAPVIDLSHLIQGVSSNSSFSTRIMMVSYPAENNTCQYLGLMAEKITETLSYPNEKLINYQENSSNKSYLSEIIFDELGMVQLIQLDYFFTTYQSLNLLPTNIIDYDSGKN